MDPWSVYSERTSTAGSNMRSAQIERESRRVNNSLPNNPSYYTVEVYPPEYSHNIDSEEAQLHKKEQQVSIVHSDEINIKRLSTMPGEDIEAGSLILWKGMYWLVRTKDAMNTVYTRTEILQCTYLLKWIEPDTRKILTQWCVITDSSTLLSGEMRASVYMLTTGDIRITMEIGRNSHTVKMNRNSRFLIDDEDSDHKLSFSLTRPIKVTSVYNGSGSFRFVLQESTATEDDNHILGIADYYKYFDRDADNYSDTGRMYSDTGSTYSSDITYDTDINQYTDSEQGTSQENTQQSSTDTGNDGTNVNQGRRVWI